MGGRPRRAILKGLRMKKEDRDEGGERNRREKTEDGRQRVEGKWVIPTCGLVGQW